METENPIHEYKGVIIGGVALAIIGTIFLINMIFSGKELIFKTPTEPLSIKAGESLKITWSSRNVKNIGLVLYKGTKPEWIAANVPASTGSYTWKIGTYQDPRTDYKIAMFEYPWRKGNEIVYTADPIEIIGPKYASCNDYSVINEWPFVPSTYANIHRVFITNGKWTGNLGGLDGADAKCQQEAGKAGYDGKFIAFIGTNDISASERITKDGVFIEAASAGDLAEGTTCHRFLASNIAKFLDKTRLAANLIPIELNTASSGLLGDIWYGRRTQSAPTQCLEIPSLGALHSFSGTYTCQNWTTDKRQVYTGAVPNEADLPHCYDTEGKNLAANYFGAPNSEIDSAGNLIISADTCDQFHRLICIEQ